MVKSSTTDDKLLLIRGFLFVLLAALLPVSKAFARDVMTVATPLTCASLRQEVNGNPWLSLPQSRIVVNPFDPNGPPVPEALGPSLPVSIGYYSGELPARLPYLWSWQWVPDGPLAAPLVEPCPLDPTAWKSEGAIAFSAAKSSLRVVLTSNQGYGSVTVPIPLDLARAPLLRIDVPAVSGLWALKIGNADAPADRPEEYYLQHDTGQTGTCLYDLPAATGWKPSHTPRHVYLRLFSVGAGGKSALTVARLERFSGANGSAPLQTLGPAIWQPQQLETRAATETGDLQAQSRITLPDRDSVAQVLRVRAAPGTGRLFLVGQFRGGTVTWDAATRSVLLTAPNFAARVQIRTPHATWAGVYDSWANWLSRRPSAAKSRALTIWAVEVTGLRDGDILPIVARFAPRLVTAKIAPIPAAFAGSIEQAIVRQEDDWNRRLATVPLPHEFALRHIDAKGITPEQLCAAYGRAWVFLWANLLPPMPENGYNYPQATCGKPSLWGEGAPKARASAQWESFIAMQFLASVDPETAWRAYEGLMSLVPPDGIMAGEGLPAVYAQTAWILYRRTNDTKRLAKVYWPIKRLLAWKVADPRWIHKGETPPDTCDAEFVVHALYDMAYARRIAETLNLPREVGYWQDKTTALDQDYLRWFWDTPDGHPYQIYREALGLRQARDSTWSLQGLMLPEDLLPAANRDSLLGFYKSVRKSNLPFLVPNLTRFPNHSALIWGLQRYGQTDDATRLAESALRDVTRAGEFAEDYDQTDPPRPDGVRPSTFGAANIIHAALWLDGIDLLENDIPPMAH